MKQRIPYIDCAKGIAILLVIFAHTISSENKIAAVLRGVIFSFHMPLFFILSCVTFRFSADGNEFLAKTEKAARHLILPAFMLGMVRIVYDTVLGNKPLCKSIVLCMTGRGGVNKFVFSSGVPVAVQNAEIAPLGMAWFLVALFFSRTLFDYLHLRIRSPKRLTLLVCIFSVVGFFFGKIQWLPLDFDIALAIQPFMLFGAYLKRVDVAKNTARGFLVSGVAFALLLTLEFLFSHTYLELAWRHYALYPVSFVTAAAGTLCVMFLSELLQHCRIFGVLNFLGLNSFLIFAIHAVDFIWRPLWAFTENNFINALVRIVIDVAFSIILFLAIRWYLNSKKSLKRCF